MPFKIRKVERKKKHNCNALDTFLCICASRSLNLQAARTLKEMETKIS